MIKHCKFCAGSHPRGRCAAFGQRCNKCHQKNHFAKWCTKKVREIEEDIDSESAESTSDDEFYIEFVTVTENEPETVHGCEELLKIDSVGDAGTTQWSITLETAGEDTSCKIDIGAQVNVLPKKYFGRLSPHPELKSTAVNLSAYNDTSIPVDGKSLIPLIHKGKKHHVLFIIVSS